MTLGVYAQAMSEEKRGSQETVARLISKLEKQEEH